MATLAMPLPDDDFDVTESAVPWRLARDAGHQVVFLTEAGGEAPRADQRLIDGVLFGQLGAAPEAIELYRQMQADPAYQRPRAWTDTALDGFDGLLLAGGHAPRMRQYLGSAALQANVADFWRTGRPVGAICHGVLVLARAQLDGRSPLYGRRTTCLPRYLEWLAYALTFWKLGRYYRTYPKYVQGEVTEALADPAHFERGRITLGARGTADDDGPAFVVEDDQYVSARWPGDAYLFARRFLSRF